MPLLLHAIGPAEAQAAAAPDSGLRPGWPVRAVCAGGFVAWTSECGEAPSLEREDVLAHHRLAEQGLAAGLCLPVRFPTWVADEHALRALLERRRDGLLSALERVTGRVELAITVTWVEDSSNPEPPTPATTPGTRFLQERQLRFAMIDQRRAAAERLARLIAADERVVEARHSATNLGLSSALLVQADDAVGVAERLRNLQEGIRILVNGPWPPYSFVSLEG